MFEKWQHFNGVLGCQTSQLSVLHPSGVIVNNDYEPMYMEFMEIRQEGKEAGIKVYVGSGRTFVQVWHAETISSICVERPGHQTV